MTRKTYGVSLSVLDTVLGCDHNDIMTKLVISDEDDWGCFLKVAFLVESASKRAIGLRLGISPDFEEVGNLPFATATKLLRETGIITEEAFHWADKVRHVRNKLVHSGQVFRFSLSDVAPSKELENYRKRATEFMFPLEGDASEALRLYHGLMSYVMMLCESLFGRTPDPRLEMPEQVLEAQLAAYKEAKAGGGTRS